MLLRKELCVPSVARGYPEMLLKCGHLHWEIIGKHYVSVAHSIPHESGSEEQRNTRNNGHYLTPRSLPGQACRINHKMPSNLVKINSSIRPERYRYLDINIKYI